LADENFMRKAQQGKGDEINTCIACNQACLDHGFQRKRATCLVNPRAGYETELNFPLTTHKKKLAVVGAGPAGLAFSCYAAQRGHEVHLFEKSSEIGGQFNYAKRIPGKEEFYETIRYFNKRIEVTGVKLHLNSAQNVASLKDANFDQVILATGIKPRRVDIQGIAHEKVMNYLDVLRDNKPVGKKVAIIGAGGIGFDVAEFLVESESLTEQPEQWLKSWGIDKTYAYSGALTQPEPEKPLRQIFLLQRKTSKIGKNLGKTTGWIHRVALQKKEVKMIGGVNYLKIDDQGLHIEINDKVQILDVDNVILCAGQVPFRELQAGLQAHNITTHLIGGADVASELDAKRAIRQGAELAAMI
jgi:2,4-dienoyl-CoA reductase (NADPH2)